MDTLAALALASEKPHGNIIRTPPIRSYDNIISNLVWRQIYGIDLYIIIVMIINIIFVPTIWANDAYVPDSTKADHYHTIMFAVFMYMQIFNFFNARIINPKAHNICEKIYNNLFFPIVVVICFLAQFALCAIGSLGFDVDELSANEQLYAIFFGASTILVSSILKLTPSSLADKIPKLIDENKEIDPNDKVLNAYNKQANAKVTDKI